MNKDDFNAISRVSFLELVSSEKTFQGRTLNYFDPVANKQMNYNIFIADSQTGLSVCIPIDRKNLIHLEKADLKRIMFQVLEQLVAALKKMPNSGKPIDYTQLHLKAGRKSSILDKIEKVNGVVVNQFRWSSIILPMRTQEEVEESQQDND
jgi:hypothetical protein